MPLNLSATKWVDASSLHWIETTTSRQDGALAFAVKSPFGERLNKKAEMEHEPLPSSRDAFFYERCIFLDFNEAEKTLERYLNSL